MKQNLMDLMKSSDVSKSAVSKQIIYPIYCEQL